MFDEQLAALKDQLVTAKQFSDVYTYFFDRLGEDPAFLEHGQREDNKFLKSVLASVGEELVKQPLSLEGSWPFV
jgi:hypothetical protein